MARHTTRQELAWADKDRNADDRHTLGGVRIVCPVDGGLPVIARHRDVITTQSKSRDRIRDLAEVYTNEREVNAMLDMVPAMFPSDERPRDIGHTFLEPACGAGNFLISILDRKLEYVKFGTLYRSAATFETAVLKSLSSIYGIDIDAENIEQSRQFLKADVAHHMNLHLNTVPVSNGFWSAVDTILATNIVRADTLKDAQQIRLVEYHWERRAGFVWREWFYLQEPDTQGDLFSSFDQSPTRDAVSIPYSVLSEHPGPRTVSANRGEED